MKKISIAWVLLAYVLAGCHVHTTSHEHEEHEMHDHGSEEHDHDHESAEHDHDHEDDDHDHNHESHAGEISYKQAQAEAVGLQTQVLQPVSFSEVIKTGGRILSAQGEEQTVVATQAGVVSLGKTPFVAGTAVRKGNALLRIVSAGLADGDVAEKVKARYEAALREYERQKSLVADRIVSAKEFEQTKLAYEEAKVAWKALADQQTADGIVVPAPMNGFLKNLQVKDGDYVSVGQPLATIAVNNRLMLRAEVSEKYYQRLPSIRSAHFRTPYDETIYQLDSLHGRMLSYGKAADSDSYYVPVTFEFDNKGSIIPGSYVEVYLLTVPMQDVLVVPVTALVEEQGLYSVFVKVHEEAYKKVFVQLGVNNGIEVQVVSGLHVGDEVVTVGAYQLKLASASNAIPAHSHHH